ncbi:MAG: type II secretion system F family protein [Gemmatimonadetes bacterium]|nr:type II secretion system F family protein [Gemmatimonadota bacterium]
MPAYAYRAVDRAGRRQRGVLEAADEAALVRLLDARGLTALEAVPAATEEEAAPALRLGTRRAVLAVTRALASLLSAGLPLGRAFAAAEHVATGYMLRVVRVVRARVERGGSVADALAEHPRAFSPLYVGLVRAGERSGDLPGALARLAAHLEREEEFRARLLSASIYPLLLATLGSVALLLLLTFVLPRFVDLLEGAGAALPWTTRALLALADFFRKAWPAVPTLLLGALLVVVWQRGTESGRRAGARLLLGLPYIGGMRRKALAARFARLVGVLMGGGAPVLHALDAAAESLPDPLARAEAERIRARVREGVTVHASVLEGGFFPPLLEQLVSVGEESGRMQEFLLKAAEILEQETERALQRLTALAEPAMIVAFGVAIGLIALSLLQAIYGVNAGALR